MDGVIIKHLEHPELKEPVLIEGLPGVGNVGKIAAEYIIEKVNAKKIIEIYSKNLPPQVLIMDNGIVKMVNNEIYHYNNGDKDFLILTGDYQGMSSEGQYEITYEILKMAKDMNVSMIYTLGGYGVGKFIDKPRVLGAATDMEIVKKMEEYGIVFSKNEPGGGIVGASGLLIGLGKKLFDTDGVCVLWGKHQAISATQKVHARF